jgi:hypothetical protein
MTHPSILATAIVVAVIAAVCGKAIDDKAKPELPRRSGT